MLKKKTELYRRKQNNRVRESYLHLGHELLLVPGGVGVPWGGVPPHLESDAAVGERQDDHGQHERDHEHGGRVQLPKREALNLTL
ncbi:hypothetical protein CDAR_426041 [Caerostris darwini]|uniref:Uncharacterized protein n=1 Tax=Caerostris darwini TaxID=1538125 RepID=A0AAV4WUV1_9ARAC|nr:hypothetical protein CDAR_426041 [Caerostris darwini]